MFCVLLVGGGGGGGVGRGRGALTMLDLLFQLLLDYSWYLPIP